MPVAAEGYPHDGSTPTSPRSVPGRGPSRGISMSGHPRTVPYHSQTLLGITGTSKAGWRSLTRSSHPPWTSIQPRGFFLWPTSIEGHMSLHILCSAPQETLGEVQPFPPPPATSFFKCLPFNSSIIITDWPPNGGTYKLYLSF